MLILYASIIIPLSISVIFESSSKMESKKHVDDYQHAFLEMLEPEVIMKEDPLSNDNITSEEDHSRSTHYDEDSFNTTPPVVSENDGNNDDATIEDLQTDIKPESLIKEEPQIKNEGRLFSCTRCEYETNTRRNFRNHMKVSHEEATKMCVCSW